MSATRPAVAFGALASRKAIGRCWLMALAVGAVALLLAGCSRPQQPTSQNTSAPAPPGVPTARTDRGSAPPESQIGSTTGEIDGKTGVVSEPRPLTPAEREPKPTGKPESRSASVGQWKTYEGAWFTISYPADFRVVPREQSTTAAEGYDGVSFISPDGQVEFYVNSPQWTGEPGWIDMTPGEDIVDSKSSENGSRQTQWVTIRGPKGEYTRSYEDTTDTATNTRLVFGFKYRDRAAFNKYRKQYLRFKDSLQQFAD